MNIIVFTPTKQHTTEDSFNNKICLTDKHESLLNLSQELVFSTNPKV